MTLFEVWIPAELRMTEIADDYHDRSFDAPAGMPVRGQNFIALKPWWQLSSGKMHWAQCLPSTSSSPSLSRNPSQACSHTGLDHPCIILHLHFGS